MAVNEGTYDNYRAQGGARKKGKHAKRGTYTLHDASNAFPTDVDGNRIYYQYTEWPRMAHRGSVAAGTYEDRWVNNEFELNQALAEGWYATALEAHEASAAVAASAESMGDDTPPKAVTPKRGPKPKAEQAA